MNVFAVKRGNEGFVQLVHHLQGYLIALMLDFFHGVHFACIHIEIFDEFRELGRGLYGKIGLFIE